MKPQPISRRTLDLMLGAMNAERVEAFLGPVAAARVEVEAYDQLVVLMLAMPEGGRLWGEVHPGRAPVVRWSFGGWNDSPEAARAFAQAIEIVAAIVEGKLSVLGDVWPEEWS